MARILVIDDDRGIRALVRVVLEAAGHEVAEASNGGMGVRRFRQEPADLVITDLLMPEKDGVEVIVELKRHHPELRMIAISGGGLGLSAEYNLEIARDFGALRTLPKPFSPKALLAAVKEVLGE